jgi:hypothetical protein
VALERTLERSVVDDAWLMNRLITAVCPIAQCIIFNTIPTPPAMKIIWKLSVCPLTSESPYIDIENGAAQGWQRTFGVVVRH